MLIGLYIFSYLLGSLPFGYWIGKAKGIDIRKLGSGNTGATNAFRHLGPALGLLVFVCDVSKGAIPVLLARSMLPSDQAPSHSVYIGLVAVLGHTFSPFLGFKGGKGVATGLGAVLGLAPVVGLLGFVVFVITLKLSRYVSLSSILGTLAVVATGFVTKQSPLFLTVFTVVCAFVIFKHVPNIKRLLAGTEPKFGAAKNQDSGGVT